MGIVRLSRDEDVLEGLFIGEGLETCLAAMADGHRPIWSAGSTGPMSGFPVLGGIEALTILADNDGNGAGLKAAREAAERWRTDGKQVQMFKRDRPGDYNDAIISRCTA